MAKTPTIVDIRPSVPGGLPHRDGGGSGLKMRKALGAIIHYSAVNYPRDRPTRDILQAEAFYHMRTTAKPGEAAPLGEYSLAYHWTVDPWDGKIYHCRDEADVLWHCGSWVDGGNGTGIAIHIPGGSALRMAEAGLQSLIWLTDDIARRHGFKRNMVRGHLEVSQTDCPGPLMTQFVKPYRSGILNWEGSTMEPFVSPLTGHTVHPDLMDTWTLERDGHPLLPAVLYNDGVIRQLFEYTCLSVGADGRADRLESIGAALQFMAGGSTGAPRYPEWPTVKPLV